MRLIFFNWAFENHGSAQDLYNYTHVARRLGHEVVLYGPPDERSAFNYSLDVKRADAVIFIFEFSTYVERLDCVRLLDAVPREHRIVLDCDGKYNDAISIVGDVNHADTATSEQWRETCDTLSDKIFQPTFHPQRPNVRTFFFHAYDAGWERPLDLRAKEFGMMYVGTNWFRWEPLARVLRAIEPVRGQVGRIGIVGEGWNSLPERYDPALVDVAHYAEPDYLDRIGVEVMPPVRFDRVVDEMSRGLFSPVVYRPLFDHLRLVTCRTFETPAANTIPLFTQEPDFVAEVYGEQATELVLPQDSPHRKIIDLFDRPAYYSEILQGMRHHLAKHFSYELQLRQLIDIVNE